MAYFVGQRELMTKLFICYLSSKVLSLQLSTANPKLMITVDSINIKIYSALKVFESRMHVMTVGTSDAANPSNAACPLVAI